MKKLFTLVLLAGLVALSWCLWTFFFPSPEKILRERMATVATTATFAAQTNPIVRAAKAQKLAGLFTTDAQLLLEPIGYSGRTFSGSDEITEAIGAGFASFPALRVEFLDVVVRVNADKVFATVGCTAKVFFGNSKDYGVQEMRFQWKKVDGAWRMTRVETVKTLT